METRAITDLEKIVDKATDATEFKLVVASLKTVLGKVPFYCTDLQLVLSRLYDEFNTEMTIEMTRKKCKVAIAAVSLAIQYN